MATFSRMRESELDGPSVARAFARVAHDLTTRFEAWPEQPVPWPEDLFTDLAMRVFEVQVKGNRPYGAYCRARGVGPGQVNDWRQIPPVPTAAFRAVELLVGPAAPETLTFRTTGTTRGATGRGTHRVRDPGLYRAALRSAFRHYMLEGLQYPPTIITLLPTFTYSPDSSLGWMLDDVREAFGGPGSLSVATKDGLDWVRLDGALRRARAQGRPVCLLGTTLAFAAWLDRSAEGEGRHDLVEGSRVMDTGGWKTDRARDRSEVMARLGMVLGVGPEYVVNEFGMTELLSQRYDHVAGRPRDSGLLESPPWLRTRALDPVTLDELPDGEVGILCHFDLANAGSVCQVLTEDLGSVVDGRVRWKGRVAGSPPRGCSLATEEILAAQTDA